MSGLTIRQKQQGRSSVRFRIASLCGRRPRAAAPPSDARSACQIPLTLVSVLMKPNAFVPFVIFVLNALRSWHAMKLASGTVTQFSMMSLSRKDSTERFVMDLPGGQNANGPLRAAGRRPGVGRTDLQVRLNATPMPTFAYACRVIPFPATRRSVLERIQSDDRDVRRNALRVLAFVLAGHVHRR